MTATIRFDSTHVLKVTLNPTTLALTAVLINETNGTVTEYTITTAE